MNLQTPVRCLITKGELTPENFALRRYEIVDLVRAAGRAGILMVQIREKEITAKQLFELTRDSTQAVEGTATKLLVNGRLDIALAAGAVGIHLPEDGLPVFEVRSGSPPSFLVGASVHSVEAALNAQKAGAGYVMFGPVFDTPGKTAQGIEKLKFVCDRLEGFPVIAVGGIDAANLSEILDAGAAGYASIRYLNELVRRN